MNRFISEGCRHPRDVIESAGNELSSGVRPLYSLFFFRPLDFLPLRRRQYDVIHPLANLLYHPEA